MNFRGYFSQGPGQWLRSAITRSSSATMAEDDRTPGSGEEPQDATDSATPAAAAAARTASRGPRVMTKPTSRRGVVSASARTGSVEGSSADAKSGAPVPNNTTTGNAMSRMAPDRSQDFGTGPDFVSSGRDVTGPFIGASTVGTTASAGIPESFSQPKTERGTTVERVHRPAPASGAVVDHSVSGHIDNVESGIYSKVNDTPPRRTGFKRKATDPHPGSAPSKRSRSLGTEAATTTPTAPPTNVTHPLVLEPGMTIDVSPVPATSTSECGPNSSSTLAPPSSPSSTTFPTAKRKKSAKTSVKASAKEEEERRILAIETKEKHVWEVETILDETDDEFLINWTAWDKNKNVVRYYPFDWIPKENVGKVAIDDWQNLREETKDKLRKIGKQGTQDSSEDEGDDMPFDGPSVSPKPQS